jgi:outer membrane receptor protein involved in Fe transport
MTVRHAAGPRLSTYLRTEWVAAHGSAGPGEVPTRRYTRLDAGAKWRIGAHLSLLAAAGNLLNARYESSAGPRWVLSPGRHGSVSAVVRLPVASR